MDFWALRRQVRELATSLPPPLLLRRFISVSSGGIGMIVTGRQQEMCWELAVDPPKQWLRVAPTWEESARETPFVRALNRVLSDARVVGWELIGWDRVVRLRFRNKASYFGDVATFHLICEFTGRVSNCLLCDGDDLVLEQLRPTGNNQARQPYQYPGNPERRSAVPESLPLSEWGRELSGFSPLIAREVKQRAETGGLSPRQTWETLLPGLEAEEGPVHLYLDGGKMKAIGVVPLRHLETTCEVMRFDRVNEALHHVFTNVLFAGMLETLRGQTLARYGKELATVREHLAEQREKLAESAAAEKWKKAGDLLLQDLSRIRPHTSSVQVPDWETGAEVEVAVDPRKTPAENAQRYFTLYKKAKRSKVEVEKRLLTLTNRETWLLEQEWFCRAAERVEDLRALREILDGRVPDKPEKEKRVKMPPTVEAEGCRFYVGRNARQNQQVTFGLGKKGDLWFHALEVPGSHVIARKSGGAFAEQDLLRGAVLAAYFSFARQSGKVAVDYTDVAHVRKVPGGSPGQVYYRHQKTLFVNPQEALRLLTGQIDPESTG